jgi:hypothetical protein
LLSLPGLFQTTATSAPADVPYLRADAALMEHWRRELRNDEGEKMKDKRVAASVSSFILHPSSIRVGIAWQGSPTFRGDAQRSISLSRFEPLTRVQGVHLVSLQKGPGTEQLETTKEESGSRKDESGRMKQEELLCSSSFIHHLSSFVLDESSGPFMDTAAIIMSLDLVVCCDTAVAHLAGALGVPVWVALSLVPDWRWLLLREDSPWYPSMRLFRQSRYGQWEDVFERMAEELRKVVNGE